MENKPSVFDQKDPTWDDYRGMIAGTDLALTLPTVTPAAVADDSNGRREKLFVLEPMVGMLQAKDVLRASKPVAYLWEWAAALVHAARAIVNRESLALKMEAQHGVHAAAAAAFDEAAAVLKARQGEQKQAEAAYQAAFEGEFENRCRERDVYESECPF